jgi:hypothetical protein
MSTTVIGAGMSAHYNTIAATRAQRTDAMKAVADTLGLTADELTAELRSDRSLVEVANGRNPDNERLIASLKKGLPPDGLRGRMAGLTDAEKTSRLSDLLQVDEIDLTDKVANGKDLLELMRDKGVHPGQLRSVLNSGDLVDVAL